MLILAGCYSDKEDQLYPQPTTGCDTANISFATHVQPVLNQYCATPQCHDAITKSFTHDLSNYEGAKTVAEKGRLLGSINREPGFLHMPKNMDKLGDCEIAKITAWVNAGTPQ